MSLWLRVRGVTTILTAFVLTLVGLSLPGSAATATPSPAGATLAAACFLALAVPVAGGWGCSRGDAQLESVSVPPVRVLDLGLLVFTVTLTSVAALAMQQAGLALAGSVAGRDVLVYLGIMLVAYPLVGWRVATLAPAAYVLAVAVVGRGEDVVHPASWAWIAADGNDRSSWVLTVISLAVGISVYLTVRPRTIRSPGDA